MTKLITSLLSVLPFEFSVLVKGTDIHLIVQAGKQSHAELLPLLNSSMASSPSPADSFICSHLFILTSDL